MIQKPKEPLLALFLSIIFPGLGQIYSGKLIQGLCFIATNVLVLFFIIFACVHPTMNTNIAFIFIPLFYIFSIFVYIDSYRSAKKFNTSNNLTQNTTWISKISLIFAIVLFVLVLSPGQLISNYVKSNVVQAFKMPAGSMSPTLMVGDRIFVDKVIYKKSEPQRGDLIVFIYPNDKKVTFVKRVVGLPNETVEIKDGSILINGTLLIEPEIFKKLHYYNRGDYGQEGASIKVPEGQYFVLGDNSSSSHDSRYWGFVPKEYVIGKAYKIFYPFKRSGPIE